MPFADRWYCGVVSGGFEKLFCKFQNQRHQGSPTSREQGSRGTWVWPSREELRQGVVLKASSLARAVPGLQLLGLTFSIPALPCPASISDGQTGTFAAAARAASEGEWRHSRGVGTPAGFWQAIIPRAVCVIGPRGNNGSPLPVLGLHGGGRRLDERIQHLMRQS